ncbi:MAG: 2-amino-4-hydroxy-6-hydroxymethyldihydropteridine diphosphokinase [Pseudomonadota bacterium]
MTARTFGKDQKALSERALAKTVVALGSNMGDRLQIIDQAIGRIEQTVGACLARSDLVETKAVVHPDDDADWHPPFLNGVAVFATNLTPSQVLNGLLAIETDLGRQRLPDSKPWQPRPIDLDLIAIDDAIINTKDLVLPHPRMHERRFVLEPMASILPEWRHPILNRTVDDLLSSL